MIIAVASRPACGGDVDKTRNESLAGALATASSETLAYYPWYISDWRGSKIRIKLSSSGRGMMRELFDYCWEVGFLPSDERLLISISGGTKAEFKKEWPIMKTAFFQQDGRFLNRKCEENRERLLRFRESRKKNATRKGRAVATEEANEKASVQAKTPTLETISLYLQKNSYGVPPLPPMGDAALPLEFEISSPSTETQKPKLRRGSLTAKQAAWFEMWWPEVWAKISRGAAERAFGVMVRDDATFDAVMAATKVQTPILKEREAKYQPHPSTWLNAKRWQDDINAIPRSVGVPAPFNSQYRQFDRPAEED